MAKRLYVFVGLGALLAGTAVAQDAQGVFAGRRRCDG